MMSATLLVPTPARPAKDSHLNSRPTPLRNPPRELTLDELLASPLVRLMMERDGVDPCFVRTLIASVARVRQQTAD